MNIGPWQLPSPVLLAPMAGITDLPFRILCRRFGAGLAISEMISANTSLWASRKTQARLQRQGEPAPISVQILGTDPKQMAEAAKINVDLGAHIIDINMGCPAKKVCKVAAGSALLRDENLVGRILEAVVEAVDVPVTLKMRTGWSPQTRNALRIAKIAENAGIQAVAIHGRTRACKFSGQAEYQTIRQVKQHLTIPVIANGDIDSERKAAWVLKFTGADAIMIGRAAQGRPWWFAHVNHYLRTGERLPTPSPQWIGELLQEHLNMLYALYGVRHGPRIARKHIAWYSKHLPGSAAFRKAINQVQSPQAQQRMVEDFFNNAQCRVSNGFASASLLDTDTTHEETA